jgi:hypothetical protein
VIRHVSSRDGGQSWSLPQDLPVRMDGSSDLVLKAALDVCGGVHVAYQSRRDIGYARFFGRWWSGQTGLSMTRTVDVALLARASGEIELLWSNYFPSEPGDTLVRFDVMRSLLRAPKYDQSAGMC